MAVKWVKISLHSEPTAIPRKIYAKKQSVRQNEFYQAAATGLRPEVMYEIHTFEYKGERHVTEGDKNYIVIRTFNRIDNKTELICEGTIGTEV